MSMGYGSDRTLKEGSMKHNSSPIVHGVGTLDSVPSGARSNETKTLHQGENPSGNVNIVVDSESNDMFGDLIQTPCTIFKIIMICKDCNIRYDVVLTMFVLSTMFTIISMVCVLCICMNFYVKFCNTIDCYRIRWRKRFAK